MVFYRGFFIFKVSLLFELLVVRLIGILVIPKFSYISKSRMLNSLIYRILYNSSYFRFFITSFVIAN